MDWGLFVLPGGFVVNYGLCCLVEGSGLAKGWVARDHHNFQHAMSQTHLLTIPLA